MQIAMNDQKNGTIKFTGGTGRFGEKYGVQKALGLARSMTYRQSRPVVVKMVKKVYRSGVTIKKKAMLAIEEKLERKKDLEPWSIRIVPQAQMG